MCAIAIVLLSFSSLRGCSSRMRKCPALSLTVAHEQTLSISPFLPLHSLCYKSTPGNKIKIAINHRIRMYLRVLLGKESMEGGRGERVPQVPSSD